MARLIEGGRDAALTYMYGAPKQEYIDFVQRENELILERYGDNEITRKFYERGRKIIEDTLVHRQYLSENLLNETKGVFEDRLTRIYLTEDFRQASRLNQRYLLANPYIRHEVKHNRLSGWGLKDTLVGDVEDDIYYRRAMSGFGQVEEGKDDVFVIHHEDDDDTDKLTLGQQMTIQQNWMYLLSKLDNGGIDPTSLEGAYL